MSRNTRGGVGRDLHRRTLLAAAAAAATLGAATPRALARARGVAASSTAVRYAEVFPISQQPTRGPYPEQSIGRYAASAGRWGVAFSGGGPRAFTAAIGQMRGLHAAGVVRDLGAISCVSGGSWFGGTYSFAPTVFADDVLLGPTVAPEEITLSGLAQVDPAFLGTRMVDASDDLLGAIVTYQLALYEAGELPFDKIYARTLNDVLLFPYGLSDLDRLFTLDAASLAAIRRRNRGFAAPFMQMRANRPFFIAGATQIYQEGAADTVATAVGLPGQLYRSVEYTPLYAGAPQLVAGGGPGGIDFGGGYVESFAFDTPAPTAITEAGIATVPVGATPFLLSDALGSSSAAIAAFVDEFLARSGGFPYFDYWPVARIGETPAFDYSFGDGGILENTGVVSLLRRGYRTIFAFVNSPLPLGHANDQSVCGIDGQISRLFGFIPSNDLGTSQSTQIFASGQFASVAAGLKAARHAGTTPVYVDRFPILADNPFGLASYAPQIFWIYNDLVESWAERLTPEVRETLGSTDPANYLANFPHYATVLQNQDELLRLTPRQVNLLAHMWAWAVERGFAIGGQAFGVPIAAA